MVKCLDLPALVGAGRTETMQAIFGANPIDGGQVYVHGKEVKIKRVRHRQSKRVLHF